MKLTVTATILILLLLPGYPGVNRPEPPAPPQESQKKNAELLKIEAQLRQIEREADPASIEVKVTGDKESDGNITVTGERETPGEPDAANTTGTKDGNANTGNANAANANATSDNGNRASRMGRRRRGGIKLVSKEETLLDIDLAELNIPDEYIKAKADAVIRNPKCGSIDGVSLIQVGVTGDYQVTEDYVYQGNGYTITVFKGFVYDRSSIPRVFWVIIDKDSLGNVPPLLHDLLYRSGGVLPKNQVSPYRTFSREDTDKLFLELMTKCGVSSVRRNLAYQAVRKFGRLAWQGKNP